MGRPAGARGNARPADPAATAARAARSGSTGLRAGCRPPSRPQGRDRSVRADRVLAGRDRDYWLGNLADVVDQLGPLAGLEHLPDLLGELGVGPEQRGERDLDLVLVIGE